MDGGEEISPEREVFRKQVVECYCMIPKSLPPNYSAILALSEIGELAVNVIAAIPVLNPSAVKNRLRRGRETLPGN